MRRADLKVGEAYYYKRGHYNPALKAVVVDLGSEGKVKVALERPEGRRTGPVLVPLSRLLATWEEGYQIAMRAERERAERAKAREEYVRSQRERRARMTERLVERIGPGHEVSPYSGTVPEHTVAALLDALDDAEVEV